MSSKSRSIIIKYVWALAAALILTVVVHAFFFTLYTYETDACKSKFLIRKSRNFPIGSLCLYKHNGQYYLSRVAARPGDSIQLIQGVAYINGCREDSFGQKFFFRKLNFSAETGKMISDSIMAEDDRSFSANNIRLKKTEFPLNSNHPVFFPHSYRFRWNADYAGPLLVPTKGIRLTAGRKHELLYSSVAKKRKDSLFFDKDFFYMLNDDRTNIADSRRFGFISEDSVVGSVVYEF